MARLVNVVRRTGTYHFRRVVPSHLRARLQRRELVRSLETTAPATGKVRADFLYWASEYLFTAAAEPMLPQDHLARLVRDFYDLSLAVNDHQRLLDGALSADAHAVGVTHLDAAVASQRAALARNEFDEGMLSLASTIIMRRAGIDHEKLGAGEANQIRQALLRASIDVTQALRARYDGDFAYEPKDAFLRNISAAGPATEGAPLGNSSSVPDTSPVQSSSASVPGDPSAAHMAAPGPVLSGPLLSEIGRAFREDQKLIKAWDAQTVNQAGATFRLFVETCGDKPILAYSRGDAEAFRKHVSRLPFDYSKAVQYRGLNVPQIVKRAEAEAATREVVFLNQRTVKRHFSTLSALWSSAVASGSVKENIFAGFRFTGGKSAKEQRPEWTRGELKTLFTTPVWTGCRSELRRSEPGSLVVRDEHYWIPLVGVYSGMRQEEICQLHVEDVREEGGIFFFDINNRPPRKLKNSTAVRKVPVHKALIRLGFLDYVEIGRGRRGALLFPNLIPGGADKRLGHAFSKWFTRYRQDIGIYRRGLDFHALRHTATTLMHQAAIDKMVIDHVTGHTSPGETARYTKGSTLKQMQDAINSVDIGFEVDALLSAGRDMIIRFRRSPQIRAAGRKRQGVERGKRPLQIE